MSESFDPYYLWLGIAPQEQPADHYRLLGLRRFEDNIDVIDTSADRQMRHVRSYQSGEHVAVSQRILNEIAAARICLLDPQKKAAYDRQLKAEESGDSATPSSAAPSSSAAPTILTKRPSPHESGAEQLPAVPMSRPKPSEPAESNAAQQATPASQSHDNDALWESDWESLPVASSMMPTPLAAHGLAPKQTSDPGDAPAASTPWLATPAGIGIAVSGAVALVLVLLGVGLLALLGGSGDYNLGDYDPGDNDPGNNDPGNNDRPAKEIASEAPALRAINRARCQTNLKQISLALLNYHDAHRTYPAPYIADADGRPMHSWRVAILPFLQQQALYEQYDFNEPWDGPNNSRLHDMMPEVFISCPSDGSVEPGMTSYMAIVGNGTVFEEGRRISLAQILDGTANTIMVVEVAGSTTHWLEPRDLDLDSLPMQINATQDGTSISSRHPGSANVVFADGTTHNLSESIDPETLRRLILRNDGMPIDYGDF